MVSGCVHVRDGVVVNIFAHLSDLPLNGVVHLNPEYTLSNEEFRASHPQDADELEIPRNLGDHSLRLCRPDNAK